MPPTTDIKARNFMTRSLVTLRPDMDVMQAMHLFVKHTISGAPVVDERGNLVGVLTERDCLKTVVQTAYHGNTVAGQVHEYMSRDVKTIDDKTGLMEVAEQLANSKFRRFPVMDETRVVGVISRRDVLRALLEIGT